jgi:nitrate reductase assembly molybdenum cofactor insertion protein NarJ
MSADLTLDMAYNQYEGFKRSNILVSIKGMYKDQEFPFDSVAKGELPDHLPVILRFLDFLQDGELKRDFRESFLIKGLEKLKKNIESKPDNPYNHLINALWVIIDKDVKGVASVQHLKE